MKVLIAGGTGFIGKPLVQRLIRDNHEVTLLTRGRGSAAVPGEAGIPVEKWDGVHLEAWSACLSRMDAVINLSGAGIADKRWSRSRKKAILESRLLSTRALVRAIEQARPRPKVLVNASAVGFYGDVPEGDVTESAPQGKGFLPEVCQAWEKEARAAKHLGVRVCLIRTGIVLGRGGGAFQKMLPPFQAGLGGPLGSGKQWFPWVHLDDMIEIFHYAAVSGHISGPINAAAPHPVRMKEFAAALGHALHRPAFLPAPALALRLLLGEMADLLLTGQRVIPAALTHAGYRFKHPDLSEALASLTSS